MPLREEKHLINKIKHCALNLLTRREHSHIELRNKLISKGYNTDDVNAVLCALIAEGLQSDERFAENYTKMRANRGYGSLSIKAELRERGLSDEIINKTINAEDNFWMDNAKKIWRKKFGGKMPSSLQERAKQVRFLQYKGFNTEQIKNVLKATDEND